MQDLKKTQTHESVPVGISIEDTNLSKTQVSDRDYKIRMFKVIKDKKEVMREK